MNDTSSENAVAKTTTNPNCRMNSPIKPLVNAIGANTATSTKVIANATAPSSRRPASAAASPRRPRRVACAIASMMTIESSTRIPIVSESPIRERTFMVKPAAHIVANAAASDAGMAIAAASDARQARKKSTITITVSATPSPIVCRTPPTAASANGASVRSSSNRTSGAFADRRANVRRSAAIACCASASGA